MNWCALLLFCTAPAPTITPGQHGRLTKAVDIYATCIPVKGGPTSEHTGRYGPFGLLTTTGNFDDFVVLDVSPDNTPEDLAVVSIEAPAFRKGEGERCRIDIAKPDFVKSTQLDPPDGGKP